VYNLGVFVAKGTRTDASESVGIPRIPACWRPLCQNQRILTQALLRLFGPRATERFGWTGPSGPWGSR